MSILSLLEFKENANIRHTLVITREGTAIIRATDICPFTGNDMHSSHLRQLEGEREWTEKSTSDNGTVASHTFT